MMSVTAECIKGGDVAAASAAVPAILLPLLYANMRYGQRATRPGFSEKLANCNYWTPLQLHLIPCRPISTDNFFTPVQTS